MDTLASLDKWFDKIHKECDTIYVIATKIYDFPDKINETEIINYYKKLNNNIRLSFVAHLLCYNNPETIISILGETDDQPDWNDVLVYFICKLFNHLNKDPTFDFHSVFDLLFSLKVDATAKNNMAIKIASAINCPELLQLLINHGADITVDDGYPICMASYYHAYDNLLLLESLGIDIHVHHEYPFCTLFTDYSRPKIYKNESEIKDIYNKQFCPAKMISFFVEHGTDINVENGFAINKCLSYSHRNIIPEFYQLVKYNADVSLINVFHLYGIMRSSDEKDIDEIMKYGVDFSKINDTGNCERFVYLREIIKFSKVNIIKKLMECGVDFSKINEYDYVGRPDDTSQKIELLVNSGVDAACLATLFLR